MQYWIIETEKEYDNTSYTVWGIAWPQGKMEDISTEKDFVENICSLFLREQVEPCHIECIVEDLLAQGAWKQENACIFDFGEVK